MEGVQRCSHRDKAQAVQPFSGHRHPAARTQRRVEHANGIAQCADDHFVGGPRHYYLIYMASNSTPARVTSVTVMGSISPKVIRPEEAVVDVHVTASTGAA